jgi:hypothetical protein
MESSDRFCGGLFYPGYFKDGIFPGTAMVDNVLQSSYEQYPGLGGLQT